WLLHARHGTGITQSHNVGGRSRSAGLAGYSAGGGGEETLSSPAASSFSRRGPIWRQGFENHSAAIPVNRNVIAFEFEPLRQKNILIRTMAHQLGSSRYVLLFLLHRKCSSMPEVPHSPHHHCQAQLVGRVDHFLVAHRASGLDNR